MRVRTSVLLLLCCLSLPASHFDFSSLAKLARVSDPQFSPDGRSIVVVVSRPNYEDDRFDANLILVDVASHHWRALTSNRRGVSSPRWSPDGSHLAFLANAADNKPQIFSMPMSGGDAVQVTKSPTGVQQFAWSPDGSRFAFAASDEPKKKTGEERHNDAFEVGDDDYLVHSAALPTHLWIVSSQGDEARRLTSGAWTLPISHPPSSPASPLAWSPDGKSIAIVKIATPHSGDSDQSAVQILDIDSGAMKAVTGRTHNEGYPSFSPDGKTLIYWYPRDGAGRNVNEIHVVPITGGDGVSVTRALDRNVMRAIWMQDGKTLLVGANDGTSVGLWTQPLQGDAKRIDLGKICPTSTFWVDAAVGPKGEIAFTGSEPLHPSELYYLPSATSAAVRVTDFNSEVAGLELGKTETFHWNGPNGFHNDGVITYPPDFQTGRRYPLVLYVHG
ncbi:MAG: S9 family peptidase, partial [Acidobacteriaceae bacterium]|nr:S9 family peptidase [Acidobacteriaceae bacterium]